MPNVSKQSYLSNLVNEALNGDSNAFAVLFAATYQDLYKKCYVVLNDEYTTQDVLFSTYVLAYKDLRNIKDFDNFIPWIDSINSGQLLRVVRKKQGESSIDTITAYDLTTSAFSRKVKKCNQTMSLNNAGQLLESIFFEVGADSNNVPIDTLYAYHQYRTNSFALQWFIVGLVLLLFALVPFYFIKPEFSLEMDKAKSSPKEAVHIIDIKGFIPIRTVVASVDGTNISVMQDDNRLYSSSSSINGNLSVTVTLYNGQQLTLTDKITTIDKDKPHVESYEPVNDTIEIVVTDKGYGVDFAKIVGVSADGPEPIYPISYDESSGKIIYPFPKADNEITIPDKVGNELKVLLSPN